MYNFWNFLYQINYSAIYSITKNVKESGTFKTVKGRELSSHVYTETSDLNTNVMWESACTLTARLDSITLYLKY